MQNLVLKESKSGFKRKMNSNKYQSKILTERQNQDYLNGSSF